MEVKSELKTATGWMPKLLRDVPLIPASSCNLWPNSLCLSTNQPRKGKYFKLYCTLPQMPECQRVPLLWMCSAFQSSDASHLINCMMCMVWKMLVPRLDGGCPMCLREGNH